MMPPRKQGTAAAAAAATATAAAAATTTKLTTSSNNNLTLTTATTVTATEASQSKRRRRRHLSWSNWISWRSWSSSSSSNSSSSHPAQTAATAATTTSTSTSSSTWSIHRPPTLLLLLPSSASACITLLLLTTTCSLCAASSPCAPNHWWDPVQDKCMPCTACQDEMLPLRPCQLHRDTICSSIYDLNIDWVVLAKTEPNWKERRKSEYEHIDGAAASLQHLTHEQLQQLKEEAAALPMDWQTAALFMAVLICLLFFSVAACILIHHMRQWRRMERRLDQDVEELSTKLMAKLAEVQSLEGGTFFIGNADALRGMPAATAASVANTTIFQPQHVLLPDKHAKHQERRILKTLQPGNVYIEENGGSSKG